MKCSLNNHITKNPSQGGTIPKAALASTVEAILGAVWLDSGKDINKVWFVMENLSGRN
jgi:ribonuclease-3